MSLKRIFKFLIFVLIISSCIIFREDISNYILENFVINKKIVVTEANTYYKSYDYGYVKLTTDFEAKSKQDLLNIFYTILDSGWTSFTFYCNKDYESCYDDITYMTRESDVLSSLNNMVNPYNSYKFLSFEISNFGKVSVNIDKLYNEEEINYVDNEIEKIMSEIINDTMTTKEKIKAFHDYIINKINYDTSLNMEKNGSNKAYGALVNKKAVCSGYSDLMAIFLDKLGIKNYKIINEEHVWNFALVDNEWLHIDLTWDDPTTSSGKDVLIHDFFLIDTEKLESISKKLKNEQHEFDKNIYIEAN